MYLRTLVIKIVLMKSYTFLSYYSYSNKKLFSKILCKKQNAEKKIRRENAENTYHNKTKNKTAIYPFSIR